MENQIDDMKGVSLWSWLGLWLPCWWQATFVLSERAWLTVNAQRVNCPPGQVIMLSSLPLGTRMQAVRFEVELTFSQQEWEQLQNSRKIPILFKWFRFSGARMFITSVVQDSNAGQGSSIVRHNNGTITYRAQSTHERITPGSWVIVPVYADNTPILLNVSEELSYQFRVP
ncbi:MAG: hypothetical protein RMJ44_06170 [Cytophagales bacterium]|nr:hypothetical protein [Bernardetiaceae bacterium]MDW8210655.1 hypothetical protein [Cytophagales bacterium]